MDSETTKPKDYAGERRAWLLAEGLCVRCGKPRRGNATKTMCGPCARADRERVKKYYQDRIARSYGITPEDYVAMKVAQKNKCEICGTKPDEGHSLHVDHSHESGKVRGLLCRACNHGLGNFRDNPALLAKAITYLKKQV